MSKRAAPVTQADISRAIRAADRAGSRQWSIEIAPDGVIRLTPYEGAGPAARPSQLPKRKIVL
jgi:hypothetical protein